MIPHISTSSVFNLVFNCQAVFGIIGNFEGSLTEKFSGFLPKNSALHCSKAFPLENETVRIALEQNINSATDGQKSCNTDMFSQPVNNGIYLGFFPLPSSNHQDSCMFSLRDFQPKNRKPRLQYREEGTKTKIYQPTLVFVEGDFYFLQWESPFFTTI